MTLSDMISVHDENALVALASIGVVRRAKRDFEAGKATVDARDDTQASVTADGKNVVILASGLNSAMCDCPATGICRHILLATFALRENLSAPALAAQSAADELHALTEDALRKFAGADWDKAINLARISAGATVALDGTNLTVQLPDIEFSIMFLAGQGLAGAVFKGTKSSKRRVTTAAALIARQQAGAQTLDQLTQDDTSSALLSTAFLVNVQTAISALVTGVFGGGAVIAEDMLFDLSISARAQSAPRLTALLRMLVHQSRKARAHHFDFRDDQFLADAALTYALAKALEQHPEDTQLTGTLRRNYRDHDNIDLAILGAVQWHAPSGARGLRIYGYALDQNAWYATGQARAAGMDPSFAPQNAYQGPLWGAGMVKDLTGSRISLRQPRISTDHQIVWDHATAIPAPAPNLIADLTTAGVIMRDWATARADIAARSPNGLRRMGSPVPILLSPTDIGAANFNDFDQCYQLAIIDQNRAVWELTIPATQHKTVAWLQTNKTVVHAVLCEASMVDLKLRLTPISVLISNPSGQLEALNLSLDTLPADKTTFGNRALSFLKDKIKFDGAPHIPAPTSNIDKLGNAIFDATAEVMRFGQSSALAELSAQADALQLALLAQALRDLAETPAADQAMRVSYLTSEIVSAGQNNPG